jgi:nicotinate phosphoribosyltransferase
MRTSSLLLDGRALLDADRLVRAGVAERRTSYELWFGRMPPHTGFLVVAGIETLLETLSRPLLGPGEVDALRSIGGFSGELCDRLSRLTLTVDVDAVPEGTIVFARTPIVTVEGPFIEAVLVGSVVRATIQKATAIATRAARLHLAAGGDAIVDGSSAHVLDPDAALAVARAAHVGGASSTTNVLAATKLSIVFRAMTRIDLGALSPAVPKGDDSWGELNEELGELGAGDDEEALLLEAKRLGSVASGWVARGLADVDARTHPLRYELVALEQGGAWAARRGASGSAPVVPGRKMLVRYSDQRGRAIADVVHLNNERMQPPASLGAAALTPVARAVIRGGRALEAPELTVAARERALAGRAALLSSVTQLRSPSIYPVKLSAGLANLRDTSSRK